ncbi:hypothetical protein EI94DRAFT_1707220 [Lactarius quietus]|nr:hypothetical protein EI94DRAFT_1707220 [Lactarius quietus]
MQSINCQQGVEDTHALQKRIKLWLSVSEHIEQGQSSNSTITSPPASTASSLTYYPHVILHYGVRASLSGKCALRILVEVAHQGFNLPLEKSLEGGPYMLHCAHKGGSPCLFYVRLSYHLVHTQSTLGRQKSLLVLMRLQQKNIRARETKAKDKPKPKARKGDTIGTIDREG